MPTVAGNLITVDAFKAGKILAKSKNGLSMKQFKAAFNHTGKHDRVDALLALNNLLDVGLAAQVDETFYIVEPYLHEFIAKPKAATHGKANHKK